MPIDRVDVTLTAPGPVAGPLCVTGREGSTDPCEATGTATGAVFAASGLDTEEGVTVSAGLPAGSLTPAAPLLVDTFSPAQAFAPRPAALGGVAVVLLAGAVALLGGRRRRPGPAPKTVVGVTDLPRARAFYAALGWRESSQSQQEVAFLQGAGTHLGLWSRSELAADSEVADDAGGWGGITLAHNVGSTPEVDEVLAEAGYTAAEVEALRAAGAFGAAEGDAP